MTEGPAAEAAGAWLVIALAAPLASFGEAGGNAQRGTAERPSRSALIGLAGAALGVRRDDVAGQAQIVSALRIASLTLRPGELITDFHTFQTLPGPAGRPSTRAEALKRRASLETSITRREYRSDVFYLAGFAVQDGSDLLPSLAEAFRRPRFALWLGRKSCPLARPLNPQVLAVPSAAAAFQAYLSADPHLLSFGFDHGVLSAECPEDLGADRAGEGARMRVHSRRDDPASRVSWQFSSRSEYVTRIRLAVQGEALP